MAFNNIRTAVLVACLAAGLSSPARSEVLTFTQAYGSDLLTVRATVTDLNNDGWIRAIALGGEVSSLTLSWTGLGAFIDATAPSFRFDYFLNGGPLGDDPGEHFEMTTQGPIVARASTNEIDYNVPNKVCDANRCGYLQMTGLELPTAALLQPALVPEPATLALVGLGLVAAAGMRQRRHLA